MEPPWNWKAMLTVCSHSIGAGDTVGDDFVIARSRHAQNVGLQPERNRDSVLRRFRNLLQ